MFVWFAGGGFRCSSALCLFVCVYIILAINPCLLYKIACGWHQNISAKGEDQEVQREISTVQPSSSLRSYPGRNLTATTKSISPLKVSQLAELFVSPPPSPQNTHTHTHPRARARTQKRYKFSEEFTKLQNVCISHKLVLLKCQCMYLFDNFIREAYFVYRVILVNVQFFFGITSKVVKLEPGYWMEKKHNSMGFSDITDLKIRPLVTTQCLDQ